MERAIAFTARPDYDGLQKQRFNAGKAIKLNGEADMITGG
jgi:hypothetical protein